MALPAYLAEQDDEALKSSCNLEFLGIRRQVKERDFESRLIDKLEVEFALKSKTHPIAVAEYPLQAAWPARLRGKLPSAEQFEESMRGALPPKA